MNRSVVNGTRIVIENEPISFCYCEKYLTYCDTDTLEHVETVSSAPGAFRQSPLENINGNSRESNPNRSHRGGEYRECITVVCRGVVLTLENF